MLRRRSCAVSNHEAMAQPILGDAARAPLLKDEEEDVRADVFHFFAKLKAFKGIAMRSEKTDRNFSAMIYICAAVINSR